MSEIDAKAYRTIVKGTAVFGGVQVFSMLISLLRGKLIAIFLGPIGIGISALFSSTMGIFNQLTSLGLGLGAVKDIAVANEMQDIQALSRIVAVVRKLVLFTALLGSFICAILSMWLSKLSFGTDEHTVSFLALSVMSFFTTLCGGEMAILQGLRKTKEIALTTVISGLVGLIAGVPLYWLLGTGGIVPAMVILSACLYFATRMYVKRVYFVPQRISSREAVREGKSVATLGFALMASSLIGSLSTYLFTIFMSHEGNLNDLGLYQAGNSISIQYVSVVFSAMAIDYFPRLASAGNDYAKTREIANKQAEIVLLIVAPLVVLLIVSSPVIIRVFLTKEFTPITSLMRWIAIGTFVKAASFPIGYLSFAIGDKKTFFIWEGVITNLVAITFNIWGYKLWGLSGLGISFFCLYVFYLFAVYYVAKSKYLFTFEGRFLSLFASLFVLCLASFISTFIIEGYVYYGVNIIIFFFLTAYCVLQLDRRIGLKRIISNRLKSNK